MADQSLDAFETRLQDASLDAKARGMVLTELRDQLESLCQPHNYASFLAKFVPIFLNTLSEPPVFTSTSPEQRVRQCTLEIIHRLPMSLDTVAMEQSAGRIVDKCLQLVKIENEDNAVLCLKIVMDICRYHTKTASIAEKAQPFLDLILEVFDGMEQTVRDTFDNQAADATSMNPGTPKNIAAPASPIATAHALAVDPSTEQAQTRQLVKGMHSFKVVAECPIIVVSIFQAHRNLAPKNVAKFKTRIRNTLSLQARAQKKAHEEAELKCDIFTGIAKEIKNSGQAAAFGELVTAQVKTMSFLAYLLRGYQPTLTDILPTLPELTVRLLRDVPRSHTATRKELLVAMRHIINFSFRGIFLSVILPLLDSRTLVGDSLTADVTLRPLAYTTLADLIHHVREQLSPAQISRVVQVYVSNLTFEDGIEMPGTSYQTMSAKLLLNMAECMSKMEDKKDARFLMMTVLNGIADKFAEMNRAYPNAVKLSRQQQNSLSAGTEIPENYFVDKDNKPDWDETDIFNAMPIKTVSPKDRTLDPVTENKFLFKNLLQGLKQFFFQLRNSNPARIKEEVDTSSAPPHWNELSSGFEAEEVEVLIKLFREGAKCFQYYAPLDPAPVEHGLSESTSGFSKEEKDLLETFGTVFHHLDPATFHEIFTSGNPQGISFLYEQSFKHPALLHIPQFLLASEATSPTFCGMLLRFLMSKLEEIGQKDSTKTSVLLRLFKLSFMAVTLFSAHNESVLLPHVRELITRSIDLSVVADEPTNYFLLLRSLFRSIGGGRFEHLYKEILPLLEMLLEVLNTQLAAATDGNTRDLFVELSLTVPARLSHLLPHLSYLMRPLTVALRAGEQAFSPEQRNPAERSQAESRGSGSNELTAQGLRTLELCVDNLTADYLDPIMQPWMDEIMGSLWRMLKPASITGTNVNAAGAQVSVVATGHLGAHTAVRILGKLGGRNRRFLTNPSQLGWRTYADDEASFDVRFIGVVSNGGERAMPSRLGIDTAIAKLMEVNKFASQKPQDDFYKRQALNLIITNAKLLLGADNLPDDLSRLVQLQAEDLLAQKFDFGSDVLSQSDCARSTAKRDAQQEILLKLIKALIFAASIDHLADDAKSFLQGLCRHFMLIELGTAVAKEKHAKRPFDVKSGEGPVYIDTSILAQALCFSLGSEIISVRETATSAIQTCLRTATTIFGTAQKAECLPFFSKLAETFNHACFEEDWFSKYAGSLGIKILADKKQMAFSDAWITARVLEMLKALLYVIKDMPQDLPANVRVQAKDIAISLIERFGSSGLESKDNLTNKESTLNMLANRLISEVSHMNRHVRDAAQLALRTLASSFEIPHYELIAPVKEPLTAPIFMKPLRALPFAAQIGYIDAVNFLLDVPADKEVLPFDDNLNRLLYETLALVDADDENLAPKPYEYRTAEAIVRLRVAGLRLLTTAIKLPGFSPGTNQGTPVVGQQAAQNQPQQTPNQQHRARVISIFFKSLYSKKKEVAAAANAGLKIVLQSTSKLPKDLLQNGLRPILMNVQDPRKLSVEGLEGLRTLLQLLHNYFKVEIGTRLLDHMKHIADPATLQRLSFTLIESQTKMKIVAAIFSVFHLLPVQAAQFLPDLVERVQSLEETLRKTQGSPFREPLIKYLNHYPNESWTYFRDRMRDRASGRFFAQIMTHPESSALREKVVKEVEGLVGTFQGGATPVQKCQASVNAIQIAHAICQFDSAAQSLLESAATRKALTDAAKFVQIHYRQGTLPQHLRLAAIQSGDQIMDILLSYMKQQPRDLDCLFNIFESCTDNDLILCPTLYNYLYHNVITNPSVDIQRAIVQRCIETYISVDKSQRMKWFVFHNVLNPILAHDAMSNWDLLFQPQNKGTNLLDKAMAEEIHNKLWKLQSPADAQDDSPPGIDHTRMAFLQTSTFLLKYHHVMLQDTKKDLIKFGWSYIRLDDHINKYAAYCLISYFIHSYETPVKITAQVYNQLLRAHQAEGRNLVTHSLEVLEPVLHRRPGGGGGGGVESRQNLSVWARFPRKILSEEINNVQQLTSVYQFMVRHPDLFYESREIFAPVIITTISKVAQLPTPSADSRKLALNLFALFWQWEERTVKEQGSLAGLDSPMGDKRSNSKKGAVANEQLRLILIKYMVQFIAMLVERFPVSPPREKESVASNILSPQTTDIVTRCLDLLHKLLSPPYWDDLNVDAMFPKVTEQILCGDNKQEERAELWNTRVVNTIQIVKVLMYSRPDDWVLARLPQLQKLLAKPLRSENNEIQDALHNEDYAENAVVKLPSLLKRALQPIPPNAPEDEMVDTDSPSTEFTSFLSSVAGDMLNNVNHVAGINILWIMAQRRPEDIDVHIPVLLKILQSRLAKDHLAAAISIPAVASGTQPPVPSALENEITVSMIIKVIDMLSARISILGEQRRPYLSVLASLVERSTNNLLCGKILSQVEAWVFQPTDPVPTLKEKVAVLQKMLLFEQRPDQSLYAQFMDLIIRVYEDSKITRSELAVRLEHAFLIGLRSQDIEMRSRFFSIYDKALSRSTSNRFFKLISEQQWDVLGDSFWLSQVIHLMFGSFDQQSLLALHQEDFRCLPASKIFGTYTGDARLADVVVQSDLDDIINQERQFIAETSSVRARDILGPLANIQHVDPNLASEIWLAYFPMCWSTLTKDDREDIEQGLLALLTKDFHQRQLDRRPNCVATLLEGITRASPRCKFPPHVMKYLAKSYDAWYTALGFMEDLAMKPLIDTPAVRESNLDALIETYAGLEESDLFYGTWRRRAGYVETNAALSYEQNGVWDKAQHMYEQAQVKARTGSLPYSQGEYMLWEDQWVLCAQKLQQWEILGEFAKHENINDLYLEAMWRNYETWTTTENREHLESVVKAVSDAPTPRRLFFQAFIALLKLHSNPENQPEFSRICDENIQLSVKNWHKLPRRITNAHVALLQNFQQLVELHEASVICQSLSGTTAANLDLKSQELKVLLGTWRDRLPNLWDDINAWQDLVTWRQHIFQLINSTYLGLIPSNGPNAATGNSYAYRGYHETAWIINRFAHVARKHQMPEVCINQLSKIYTLPNIEIQEAFLKLREQAKCHYQNRTELTSGLDVINNTNLSYFGQQQKAEFYTLKGMFLSKLNQKDEAQDAFGTALFFDIKLPKAWAEWGRYSDNLFKEDPTNLEFAGNALSCYLEAAGQYKSAKSRKLLSRILWLLSLDDTEGTLEKNYYNFKGDHPWWYWVTFIPQLLNNLSRSESEAKISHQILTNLAKTYPQALHFQLRTSHEDLQVIRKSILQKEQKEKAARAKAEATKQEPSTTPGPSNSQAQASTSTKQEPNGTGGTEDVTMKDAGQETKAEPAKPKKAWEYTEALTIALRTAFPLLYASMEAMVEQCQRHFKCPPDEDAYRLIVALLNDALSYVGRSPHSFSAENKLPPQTEANISRFAESILPQRLRKAFESDFVAIKPTMFQYIVKLQRWRDKLAERLDRRSATFNLADTTYLSGFRFVWYDEVEIPGQYLLHKDKNQDFVRIERFMPVVDLVRGVASCHRRLRIRGHDGSVHAFAIQHPAPRHSRREERILQLFRIFNSTLAKKKESRRRNLQFHLPVMVPLSPQIRMIQDDLSYISLHGIYDDYCRRHELDKDHPIMFTLEKMRSVASHKQDQWVNMRIEALSHVQDQFVPSTIVRQFFAMTYPSYDDFWLFRRQFSYQLAAVTFITFTMFMTVRYPNKMHIARGTGNIWGSELLPFMPNSRPVFSQPEPVPFRLTPNLQMLMGPIHTEGIFVCALMAIARCLTMDSTSTTLSPPAAGVDGAGPTPQPNGVAGTTETSNCELEHHLSIFIRDEIAFWYMSSHRQNIKENEMREHVQKNAELIVNKAVAIAKEPAGSNLPASQSVLDLVARATNPEKLSQTDLLWMPWL